LSTEPHLIQVAGTAPSETTRVDEIAIETAKGKVTAVVAVMSIFSKKDASRRAQISGIISLLTKKRKVPISWRKIPAD
jgi:hypothetical protein